MSDTTIQTPPTEQSAARRRFGWAINGALAIAAAAAVTVVAYPHLPHSPAVVVTAGCNAAGGYVHVNMRHFPAGRADIVLYTAGDAWANSDNPEIAGGAGDYIVNRVPAGRVTVEVTPEGQGVVTTTEDVPSCPE